MNSFAHTDAFLRLYQQFNISNDTDIKAYRDYLKSTHALAAEKLREGMSVRILLQANAWVIDNLLKDIWLQHLPEADSPACLVAVGGYGRSELHPHSDIDLLILVQDEQSDILNETLSQYLTLLWDIGLDVGHSVRTIDECIEVASSDLSTITNLIESRYLSGNAELYERLQHTTSGQNMWPSQDFFRAKLNERKARHQKFGDSSYRVEPNLKEGRGGLRDIQMISWIIKREYDHLSLYELHEHQLLEPGEFTLLESGREFLWKIRFLLHELAGRKEDRLLFDHQYSLAQAMGYNDPNRNIAVEAFMHEYYRNITELERLTDVIVGVLQDQILLPKYPPPVMLGEWYQKFGDQIAVTSPDVFVLYPTALLEIFLVMQITPGINGLTPNTIRQIRNNLHRIDNSFRQQASHRRIFRQIMQQKNGITFVMRLMNRYGILAAYIPAFAHIVGRMQYDLFHVYTVDEHTLWVVRNLRYYSTTMAEQELPLCSRVFKTLKKPEILYFAGLFHDIAKGRQGDHSILGAVDAYDFCREHGMNLHDASLVSWLVRNHLIMSVTAQRKDISDMEVIQDFADQVVEQSRLDYLFLLTVADIRGTNPTLWNSWRESLLTDLYQSTRKRLQSRIPHSHQSNALLQEKRRSALEYLSAEGMDKQQCENLWRTLGEEYLMQHSVESICWHAEHLITSSTQALPLVQIRETTSGGINVLFIYAQDHGDLFYRVVTTAEQLNLNIVEARLVSVDEYDLYTLHVLGPNHQVIRSKGDEDHITTSFQHNLQVEVLTLSHQRKPRILGNFDTPTRVKFRQNIERELTEMELFTGDMPGLLSRIGAVFETLELRVHHAKITTLGEQAEDVFYVTHWDGAMVTNAGEQERIREAVVKAVDS